MLARRCCLTCWPQCGRSRALTSTELNACCWIQRHDGVPVRVHENSVQQEEISRKIVMCSSSASMWTHSASLLSSRRVAVMIIFLLDIVCFTNSAINLFLARQGKKQHKKHNNKNNAAMRRGLSYQGRPLRLRNQKGHGRNQRRLFRKQNTGPWAGRSPPTQRSSH